jgi:transcriptional regulator with XRE-family HTH domain
VAQPRPTVRRRRVGAALRRMRLAANVKMEEAAERIDGDKPKVSRIENGRMSVRRLEIEALLELYGVTDPQTIAALVALSRESKKKGWWQQYGEELDPDFQERLDLEDDAVRIHTYQPLLVPGLLQTRDYAKALMGRVAKSAAPDELDKWVDMRMARQQIFDRPAPPQFLCILDEALLRREIGGAGVLAAQLDRLIEVNSPPELTVQVVPFEQGWHAGLDGGFTTYSYPDPLDLDVVSVDYLDGALYLEEDASVERYRRAFDQLRASALSSHQSMELISRLSRDLKR